MSLKYSTLRDKIGWALGYTATSANWSTEQTRHIQDCLDGGLRQVYHPPIMPGERRVHRWSFLEPTTTFATVAPHETGTVTIVAGVVTFSSATVPSWAAEGDLVVDDVAYAVSTRDSSSQVTLEDTTVAASAGTSYALHRMAYTMPDDFGGIIGPFTYKPESQRWVDILIVPEGDLRSMRSRTGVARTGVPQYATIRPRATDGTGQRNEVLFWPVPDSIYRLEYKYHALQNTLSSDQYPLGGEALAQTILCSCLAYADRHYNDGRNPDVQAEFMQRLQASIDHDRQVPNRAEWNGTLIDTDEVLTAGRPRRPYIVEAPS